MVQSESGLHQNWMRDYDPTTGRYIQAGPLSLVDGASVYGYVLQNPARYNDFMGLEAGVTIWGDAGWGSSLFGHASAYVNGEVFMFGPNCLPGVCILDRDDYYDKNTFREGTEIVLDSEPWQEVVFAHCLRSVSNDYSAL